MKIAIIGSGGMGCLYGSYLARGKDDVWLFDHWEAHIAKIRQDGLSVVAANDEFTVHPHATTRFDEIGPVDLVIICVKSFWTTEAAMLAEMVMKPETIVLTLQNGMGNAEQLAEKVGADRLLVGATLMGGAVLEPGLVMHSGLKPTNIASWIKGHNEKMINQLKELFIKVGLPTVGETNVDSLLWSKLSIHAGLNAVTALTRATNQQFLQSPEACRLAKMAVAEVVAVATVAGVPLLYSNCAKEMLAYAYEMQEQQSPMLQDVLHKLKTEVDAINGSVIAAGKQYGVPTPVNETLTLAIKTVEQLYAK